MFMTASKMIILASLNSLNVHRTARWIANYDSGGHCFTRAATSRPSSITAIA